MVDASASDMLIDNKVLTEFKGAFSEQFVAQELISMPEKAENIHLLKVPTIKLSLQSMKQVTAILHPICRQVPQMPTAYSL